MYLIFLPRCVLHTLLWPHPWFCREKKYRIPPELELSKQNCIFAFQFPNVVSVDVSKHSQPTIHPENPRITECRRQGTLFLGGGLLRESRSTGIPCHRHRSGHEPPCLPPWNRPNVRRPRQRQRWPFRVLLWLPLIIVTWMCSRRMASFFSSVSSGLTVISPKFCWNYNWFYRFPQIRIVFVPEWRTHYKNNNNKSQVQEEKEKFKIDFLQPSLNPPKNLWRNCRGKRFLIFFLQKIAHKFCATISWRKIKQRMRKKSKEGENRTKTEISHKTPLKKVLTALVKRQPKQLCCGFETLVFHEVVSLKAADKKNSIFLKSKILWNRIGIKWHLAHVPLFFSFAIILFGDLGCKVGVHL